MKIVKPNKVKVFVTVSIVALDDDGRQTNIFHEKDFPAVYVDDIHYVLKRAAEVVHERLEN